MTLLDNRQDLCIHRGLLMVTLSPNPYSIFETIHFKEHLC